MLSAIAQARFPAEQQVLLSRLSTVLAEIADLATGNAAFPQTLEPVAFFNEYIEFGLGTYATKLHQLYLGAEQAIERQSYLVYAQCGRAILENIATLRFYARHADIAGVSSAWQRGCLTDELLRKGNASLDRFLRGNRFAWDALLDGRIKDLSSTPHQEGLSQVNSTTCLQKWGKDSPNLEALYSLFCDLVHPNLGSNLLVLNSRDGRLIAGPVQPSDSAPFVIGPTLAGLLGAFTEARNAMQLLASSMLSPAQSSHTQ